MSNNTIALENIFLDTNSSGDTASIKFQLDDGDSLSLIISENQSLDVVINRVEALLIQMRIKSGLI